MPSSSNFVLAQISKWGTEIFGELAAFQTPMIMKLLPLL